MKIAENLVEIEILSETLCCIANTEISSVKLKVLMLLKQFKIASPKVLMSKTGLIKSNLALTCKQLKEENYIDVIQSVKDKRSVEYCLTLKGETVLKKILNNVTKFYREDEISDEIRKSFEIVVNFLNKKL